MPTTKLLRTASVAFAAAALTAILPAALANAEPIGPTDPGVRCAAKVGPGQYEFYLPGEKATDVNGNKWVCGPDGQWFRDYSALVTAPSITISGFAVVKYTNTATATLSK
jgi:hypothetical protein